MDTPVFDEVWYLVHKLWGEATSQPNYNKEEWKKLQSLLENIQQSYLRGDHDN
jgi:hypothetical protein